MEQTASPWPGRVCGRRLTTWAPGVARQRSVSSPACRQPGSCRGPWPRASSQLHPPSRSPPPWPWRQPSTSGPSSPTLAASPALTKPAIRSSRIRPAPLPHHPPMKSSRLVCHRIRAGCRLYPTWSRFLLAGEIPWFIIVFVSYGLWVCDCSLEDRFNWQIRLQITLEFLSNLLMYGLLLPVVWPCQGQQSSLSFTV